MARPSASFCHWPRRELGAIRVGLAELRREPLLEAADDVAGVGPIEGCLDGRLIVDERQVADADRLPGDELEAGEVLETRGDSLPPARRGDAGQVGAVGPDHARRGLVEAAEQLHERALAGAVLADDGHGRAGRQAQVDARQHDSVGARVAEGHVLETDAVGEALGNGPVGARRLALGDVLLEPLEAGIGSGDPLEVVQQRDRGRDLLIDLGRQSDREHHVADAAMAAYGVVDDDQDTGDVPPAKMSWPAAW